MILNKALVIIFFKKLKNIYKAISAIILDLYYMIFNKVLGILFSKKLKNIYKAISARSKNSIFYFLTQSKLIEYILCNRFLVRLHGEYNITLALWKHHVNLLLEK